jgi:CubicO group peptidase (beta-lactamase class C family)
MCSKVVRRVLFVVLACLAPLPACPAQAAEPAGHYYPGKWDDWLARKPAEVGMDAALLDRAIAFSQAHETTRPRDLDLAVRTSIAGQAYDELIGPTKPRGGVSGIVLRHGYIVAEWGDTRRVDMTFSATKSYLATTAGLAFDKGLIRKLGDPVKDYVPGKLFDSPHNSAITWHHLLNQTSEWEGTLWGKPDWADRPSDKPDEWLTRPRNKAGTVYKYNDTRVNVLALATLNLWRRPLPQVLKEKIMDPMGASNTWRWFGYDNAWVVIDGQPVQSVTGGGHWGGGMFINAYDMARFGYLTLRRGKWGDRQLLSETWVNMALTPTGLQSPYGFINYFLNTDRKQWPSAPATAFMHNGNGLNMVYVDPEHDVVAVVRWIENSAADGFVKRLIAAVAAKS